MKLPTRCFDALYHVGTMNPEHKKPGSHEGNGLSVSVHPEEWKQIVPGYVEGDIWILSKTGGLFLDALKLSNTQKNMIKKEAEKAEWIITAENYRVTWYDDEEECERYMIFDSYAEAEKEAEFMDEPVTSEPGWKAGPVLTERLGWSPDVLLLEDIVTTFYVEDFTELDGVWWAEKLKVESYSAPRGVIVPSRLMHWSADLTPAASP